MIPLDTNNLVCARRRDLPAHKRAFGVVADALGETEQVGLRRPVLQEFLAVVTIARIFAEPTPAEPTLSRRPGGRGRPPTVACAQRHGE